MKEIVLHLLDIAENSVSARARNITVTVSEDLAVDRLAISIQDDGRGMSAETARQVLDPFVTSRTTRKVGLGLPLLKAAAESCGGDLQIASQPGKGTLVSVDFQHSHLDRMPLGDLPGTMLALIIGHPEIHWRLVYTGRRPNEAQPRRFIFDDAPIKDALGGAVPLTEPDVLAYIRTSLSEGIDEIRRHLIPEFPASHPAGLKQ